MVSATIAMDRMYRLQRHIYDPTRKFYLLGRDATLAAMALPAGARVLEVGCGTGRNLVRLAQLYLDAELVGIDASAAMLDTAARRVAAAGLAGRIRLIHCLAEDHVRPHGYDAVLFSYVLSMIPAWQPALGRALANLKPGGAVHVVDFWDQLQLPAWFGWVLRRWLSLFGVTYRPALLAQFRQMHRQGRGRLELAPVGGRYAFRLRFTVPA